MRTARTLAYGGMSPWQKAPGQRPPGQKPPSDRDPPSPVKRMTDTCKNITLFAGGKNRSKNEGEMFSFSFWTPLLI